MRSVQKAIDFLDDAVTFTNITRLDIHWIKAHVGHAGNELADQAALKGAQDASLLVDDPPALPKAIINAAADQIGMNLWKAEWKALPATVVRQTKLWFPDGPRPRFSFKLLRLPRVACGQMIQFLTGH